MREPVPQVMILVRNSVPGARCVHQGNAWPDSRFVVVAGWDGRVVAWGPNRLQAWKAAARLLTPFTIAELLERDSRSAVRFEMDNLREAVLRDAAAYGVSYWEEPCELEDWAIEEIHRRES